MAWRAAPTRPRAAGPTRSGRARAHPCLLQPPRPADVHVERENALEVDAEGDRRPVGDVSGSRPRSRSTANEAGIPSTPALRGSPPGPPTSRTCRLSRRAGCSRPTTVRASSPACASAGAWTGTASRPAGHPRDPQRLPHGRLHGGHTLRGGPGIDLSSEAPATDSAFKPSDTTRSNVARICSCGLMGQSVKWRALDSGRHSSASRALSADCTNSCSPVPFSSHLVQLTEKVSARMLSNWMLKVTGGR